MNFFSKLVNLEVCHEFMVQVSRSLKTFKTIKSGLQCQYYFSLADFVFTSECPHYSRVLFFTFMSTCTTQQNIHLH